MEKEVTIYDIAKEINVSAATVSRALNSHPSISSKMKLLIQAKAEELGYRSNKFASNLRQKKTNTIGVIIPKLNSYFMSSVLAGMEKIANEAGYNLIISQSLESEKKEIINAQIMFNSRVDALLVSLAYDTEGFGHFQGFIDKGIPLIFFDRTPSNLDSINIVIDNKKAGYDVTKHLIEQGCKRIAHIAGNLKRNVYFDRLEGYKLALLEHNIPFDDQLVIESEMTHESATATIDKILEINPLPDGLFTANDSLAVSSINLLKKRGIDIPSDIAVAGFNNDPVATIIEPNLTTINYPGKEMGELALQTVLNHLNGTITNIPTNPIILHSNLIIRASSIRRKN